METSKESVVVVLLWSLDRIDEYGLVKVVEECRHHRGEENRLTP